MMERRHILISFVVLVWLLRYIYFSLNCKCAFTFVKIFHKNIEYGDLSPTLTNYFTNLFLHVTGKLVQASWRQTPGWRRSRGSPRSTWTRWESTELRTSLRPRLKNCPSQTSSTQKSYRSRRRSEEMPRRRPSGDSSLKRKLPCFNRHRV